MKKQAFSNEIICISIYCNSNMYLSDILCGIHFDNSRQKYVLSSAHTKYYSALMDDVSIFDATVGWWDKI